MENVKMENVKMEELKETHMRGFLSVEKGISSNLDCDFGIQIGIDGKVWICIDGVAFIRFKPALKQHKS